MLQEQIFEDIKTAMREKDTLAKGVLTIIKSNIDLLGIDLKRPPTEDEMLGVIKKELKQTEQALAGARDAKRDDLIDKEQRKIQLIKSYLPQQLTYEEIIQALSVEINTSMNMGEAMKIARPLLGASADGALISRAVKELLQGGN